MIDTIRILTAITRAPITPAAIFKALGEKPPGFYDTLEALERFELIRINRLDGHRPTLTVELTNLGAERVVESLLGANQEIPEGLIRKRKKRGPMPKRGLWDGVQNRIWSDYGANQLEGHVPRIVRERLKRR